jgi:hypothetical protein
MNASKIGGRRALLRAAALLPFAGIRAAPAQTPRPEFPVSVANWGTTGNNDAEDTARIQRALDEAPVGCDLIFPAGSYRIVRQLNVTRRVNIVGQGAMFFGNFGADRSGDMFAINIVDEISRDNRCQRIEGIRASFITGGRNLIRVSNQPPNNANIGMLIRNNVLATLPDSTGHCIRMEGLGTHFNTIEDCQIENGIHLACADGTIVTGCLIFGEKPAVTLDLFEGAFHTRILTNGLIARDGALHIRNGSQVFFEGNHIEQAQIYGRNRSTSGASLWIESQRYVSRFIHVSRNNFGGGTNLDTNIHVDRSCEDLFIDHNMFNVTGSGHDIRLMDPSVKWARIGPNNAVRGLPAQRPGLDPGDPLRVLDRATGSYGIKKGAADLGGLQNGWAGTPDLRFWKSLDDVLRFEGRLRVGRNGPGTAVGRLPDGFRPRSDTAILCPTGDGPATLLVGADGTIRALQVLPAAELHMGGIQLTCRGRTSHPAGV